MLIRYGQMITFITGGSSTDRIDYTLTRLLMWHLAIGSVMWYAVNEYWFAIVMVLGIITTIRYGRYAQASRQAMIADLKTEYPDAEIVQL